MIMRFDDGKPLMTPAPATRTTVPGYELTCVRCGQNMGTGDHGPGRCKPAPVERWSCEKHDAPLDGDNRCPICIPAPVPATPSARMSENVMIAAGRGMLAADPDLYARCLDTPGFAYHFNQMFLAARERDAAREEVARVTKLHNECHDEIERGQERLARLGKLVEEAPHDDECHLSYAWHFDKSHDELCQPPCKGCDCWKKEAANG